MIGLVAAVVLVRYATMLRLTGGRGLLCREYRGGLGLRCYYVTVRLCRGATGDWAAPFWVCATMLRPASDWGVAGDGGAWLGVIPGCASLVAGARPGIGAFPLVGCVTMLRLAGGRMCPAQCRGVSWLDVLLCYALSAAGLVVMDGSPFLAGGAVRLRLGCSWGVGRVGRADVLLCYARAVSMARTGLGRRSRGGGYQGTGAAMNVPAPFGCLGAWASPGDFDWRVLCAERRRPGHDVVSRTSLVIGSVGDVRPRDGASADLFPERARVTMLRLACCYVTISVLLGYARCVTRLRKWGFLRLNLPWSHIKPHIPIGYMGRASNRLKACWTPFLRGWRASSGSRK